MALQQWELYESMSVLKDSGTTTTICNVPGTGQQGAADGCKIVQTATGNRSAAAATTASGNNGCWQSAEEPQRSAARKRPAAAAANDPANAFLAQANSIERRVTKKINIIKDNCNDERRGDEDESQLFLLSLLPYLRDVPKHRKLTVRHKLQKVFIDELDKRGDDQHAASDADQPQPLHPPPVPPLQPLQLPPPPPPYPQKYEFGGYVPPQRASAAAGKPPGAVDRPPKPHACGRRTQRASPQPAAGKYVGDVPLLNIDYSTSMKPTVYFNGKALADFPAAHDMLLYGRNHCAADAPQSSVGNAAFPDPQAATAVTANPADVTADDNPWTYCNI